MIERLQRALEHIEELPIHEQEEIAEQIEQYLEPLGVATGNLAGSMPDLPDDTQEILLRMRRDSQPSAPVDEQLRWLVDE